MSIKLTLKDTGISAAELEARRKDAREALEKVRSGELDFTGWVHQPTEFDEEKISEIYEAAETIRQKADVFLVLGVGGSFMGAKAVIDLLGGDGKTTVLFAGYNFSARYINNLLDEMEGKDVCLCVISKSGTTTETLSAYGIFKAWMIEKYGAEETARRTFVVTENRSNYLFDEATEEDCTIFDLAVDIGGRYSVLTPVGLLPVAVAGIDIAALMDGARSLAGDGDFPEEWLDYAITRQILAERGKNIEVFEFFDPYAAYIGEWLKQLFGESEGKNGVGIFPVSLMFSRDLHSMGQFLQQGTPCFFETFITAEETLTDVQIPETAMAPFAGKTIEQIGECAEKGVYDAHVAAGTPVISIKADAFSPKTTGELRYFFEIQCAVSALRSGVNPFDQPGVEAYKKEMRAYINEL